MDANILVVTRKNTGPIYIFLPWVSVISIRDVDDFTFINLRDGREYHIVEKASYVVAMMEDLRVKYGSS